jgi:hypothetical protein
MRILSAMVVMATLLAGAAQASAYLAPRAAYACHDGNYGIANALAGARYQERQAAAGTADPAPAAKPGVRR